MLFIYYGGYERLLKNGKHVSGATFLFLRQNVNVVTSDSGQNS